MLISKFLPGTRVKIIRTVDAEPFGTYAPGLKGVITETYHDRADGMLGLIKLDDHFEDLTEWDNQLQVWEEDGELCTVHNFSILV